MIKESIHQYANTCKIKIPASLVLKINGQRQSESVQTARQFAVGEKVTVELGYNGKLRREFVGFVSRLNLTTPVEIECEGYSYLLRKKKNIKKSWANTTLLEVLKEVVKDTEVKLHPKIPNIPLKNLVINNASGTQVLDYLIELLKGTITACFLDDVLFVGLTYTDLAETTVKYQLGFNTISDDCLKYHQADDVNVKVEFRYKGADGTEKKTNQGVGGGIVRREDVSAVSEQAWLDQMAKAKVLQETFDGYEGEIETFLIPYCRMGYRGEVNGGRYPERGGNYFVSGVEITYGQGGARRTPELDLKLS